MQGGVQFDGAPLSAENMDNLVRFEGTSRSPVDATLGVSNG
jgi:hypothetical protein